MCGRRDKSMDINAIVSAIGSLGFPIVACTALFWQNWKQSEQHKAETDKLSESLNNNTLVMQKLLDKLDKE